MRSTHAHIVSVVVDYIMHRESNGRFSPELADTLTDLLLSPLGDEKDKRLIREVICWSGLEALIYVRDKVRAIMEELERELEKE